ncbi:hypothetical protein K2173_023540 [Erythroxylum novogranatense]|uniref:Senescence regulator n=1 Tax=Erythroxylum novogranatense TaxID=1862640 RepID=A0AAV8TNY7_9ROSI|nr:hypothetical protein K2173_023540 [Erythroxylum novogranatense]
MATGKNYFAIQNYRFLSTGDQTHMPLTHDSGFELDESDIYSSSVTARSNSPEFRKAIQKSRISKKSATISTRRGDPGDRGTGRAASVPVNIPDWSKILKDEYRDNQRREMEDDDDDDLQEDDCFEGGRVPPHEFLARQRMASFSVHEGIGRTLKGRDLRKVRNAIWEKTGYQD